MINLPQPPTGTKPIYQWLNRLVLFLRTLRPLESPDFRLEKTGDGWRYRAKESAGGTSGSEYLTWRVRVNGVVKDVEIDSKPPTPIEE
jgi:hypothetical protein